METDRVKLNRKQADELLADGKQVHTFMNPAPSVLLGADWEREALLKLADEGKAELAGPAATKAKHGVVVFSNGDAVFCATK
jgi:hypothetical protein